MHDVSHESDSALDQLERQCEIVTTSLRCLVFLIQKASYFGKLLHYVAAWNIK